MIRRKIAIEKKKSYFTRVQECADSRDMSGQVRSFRKKDEVKSESAQIVSDDGTALRQV